MISFWERELWFEEIDFLIIGAGFTGLFSALSLREKYPWAKILVAERHHIAKGASTKNAGFACFGSVGEILDDLLDEDFDSTLKRIVKRYEGLQKLRAHIPDVHCAYQSTGGYEVFRNGEEKYFEKCLAFMPELNESLKKLLGFEPYAAHPKDVFGFKNISGIISIAQEGMLHPAKAISYLQQKCASKDIMCIHGLNIKHIEPGNDSVAIETDELKFKVNNVLLATNAFSKSLLPEAEVVPARGQVMITSPINDLPFEGTFHIEKGYYYFRNVGNRVLLGGGRNLDLKGEETFSLTLNNTIQDELERMLKTVILPGQNFQIEQRWSGIMGFGPKGEKEPIIKKVKPNVVVACRLGGMGVALSAQVAEDAAGLF